MNEKPGIFQNWAWWIGCLMAFTLLWAVLIWVLIRAEEREAEPVLAAVIAAPPPCQPPLFSWETLRKDRAKGWMVLCPRGTQPSTGSILSPQSEG